MSNAFESGERKVVPAVLVYVRWQDLILMVHRNAKPNDYHSGKWNGLGGKLELDESPLEAAKRELEEESGLDLPADAFRSIGSLTFPNFKSHKNEDWAVWVFTARIEALEAPPLTSSGEGDLHWVRASEVLDLGLWAGDREFLPWVIEERPFVGTIWYEGEKVKRSWMQPLS